MKRIIIENALMLFVEDLKCEHVVKNDVEWVVDLATSTILSLQKDCLASHHMILSGLLIRLLIPIFGRTCGMLIICLRNFFLSCGKYYMVLSFLPDFISIKKRKNKYNRCNGSECGCGQRYGPG